MRKGDRLQRQPGQLVTRLTTPLTRGLLPSEFGVERDERSSKVTRSDMDSTTKPKPGMARPKAGKTGRGGRGGRKKHTPR